MTLECPERSVEPNSVVGKPSAVKRGWLGRNDRTTGRGCCLGGVGRVVGGRAATAGGSRLATAGGGGALPVTSGGAAVAFGNSGADGVGLAVSGAVASGTGGSAVAGGSTDGATGGVGRAGVGGEISAGGGGGLDDALSWVSTPGVCDGIGACDGRSVGGNGDD